MYSIIQDNIRSELGKKREKYWPQSFITPFTILPLGTLSDVTVTSVNNDIFSLPELAKHTFPYLFSVFV